MEIKDKLTHLLQRLKKTNSNHADRKVRDMPLHAISCVTTLITVVQSQQAVRSAVRPTQYAPPSASGAINISPSLKM